MFKMIGAGNTSGMFAIAVFLTIGMRTGGVVIAAKFCLILFAVGFGLFFYAYRTLYKCAGCMEDGLVALRRGLDVPNATIAEAVELSESTGVPIFIAAICFIVASGIAIIGLLFS